MERSITMPKMGMTMTEGTILGWLYREGDMIEKGEPLVEVMTDKVNIEVEAPFTGRLTQILAHDGDVLPVGARIATLVDDKDTGASSAAPSAPASRSAPVASTPAAKREAALHAVDLHDVIQAGSVPPLSRADILNFVENRQPQKIRATPVAQKMAQEHHIDLAALSTSKAGAKVTRADIESHLAKELQPEPTAREEALPVARAASLSEPSASDEVSQDYELIPLSPVRRLIGQRMLSSIATAPHIYLDTEIDMTEAENCRQSVGRGLQKQGEPVPSLTAVLLRACAAALVRHLQVNATLEQGGSQGKDVIRRWRSVHIGIAVDTEQALLTPVIRNAHQQTLPELARELRRLTQGAREGTLKPDELANATFTISNLGMYDIDTFHAIIAPGQSAILAVGKVTKRGMVIEDAQGERLEIRPTMKVSLSADHRVLDGASASRFLRQLKIFLENPYFLL